MPEQRYLALDIGGTKIGAALVRLAAAADSDVGADTAPASAAVSAPVIEHSATTPTPAAAGPEAIIASALELAEQVRGGAQLRAVGIASAGVIDTELGRVTDATGSLAAWAGTDLSGPFAEHFGVPAAALNDVHAHGLGEARYGVGAGRSSMLLVAVGTGIGGCHLIGGSPVVGARGAAGHIGHLPVPEAEGVPCPCGRVGHLEGLASGPGIVQLAVRLGARDEAGSAPGDGHALARAAATGDPGALEAYRIAGYATGRVIGGVLNTLDAEVVALTGGVTEAAGPWREALSEGLAHDAMDVVAATPVLPANAGTHAALLGAAARARDYTARPQTAGDPLI